MPPIIQRTHCAIELTAGRHRLTAACDAPPGATIILRVPAGLPVDPEIDRAVQFSAPGVHWHIRSTDPATATRWARAITHGTREVLEA